MSKSEDSSTVDEQNIHHRGSDGQFSSERDSACDSSYYSTGMRKRKKGSLTDKDETGRGRQKTGQGKYRCKDDSPKWESLYKEFVDGEAEDVASDESVDVPQDMYDCAKLRQKDKVLMRKLKAAVKDAKQGGKQQCGLSIDDAVRIINTLELAQKGKAYDTGGKG